MYRIRANEGQYMAIAAADVIPLSRARANLSELADEVKAGAEKIITKNGESYVALIDAARLDYYHRLEQERIHLVLLDDIEKGLADLDAGRAEGVREVLVELRRIERAQVPRRSAGRTVKPKTSER
jgi:prevent-host-death family protein